MNTKFKRYLQVYLGPAGLFLLLLLGLWQLNAVFYFGAIALFFVFFYQSFIPSLKKEKPFNLHFIDKIAVVLAFAQYLLFLLSDSRPLGVKYLCSALLAITMYFLFRFIGFRGQARKNFIIQTVAIWSGILGLITLLSFTLFRFNIQYEGFDDVINFRSLYHPVGMLSNDWVGFLLLFLPFSGVAYFAASNKYFKWGAGVSMALLCFGLVVSFSRAAYLSVIIFVLALVVLMFLWKIKTLKSYLFALVLLVIIGVEALPFKNDVVTTLGMAKTTSQVRSINGRKLLWEGAWKMIKDHPIKGVGYGNFIVNRNQYLNRTEDSFFTGRVTNSYLQLLAEQGVIGFIAWFLFIAGIGFVLLKIGVIKNISHKEKVQAAIFLSGLLAFGAREMFFSSFFENIGLQVLLAVIGAWGVNVLLPKQNYKFKKEESPASDKFKVFNIHIVGMVVLFGVCIASSIYFFRIQRGNVYNNEFLQTLNEGEKDEAQKAINKAIKFQNDNALFYATRALFSDTLFQNTSDLFFLQGFDRTPINLEQPINDLKKAIELSPNDAMFHHNLGWLYLFSGDTTNGKYQLEQAVELEPFTSIYQVSLGTCLYHYGKKETSKECFLKAVKYSPDFLDSKFWEELMKADSAFRPENMREQIKIKTDNNPILCSRQAKIFLHQGDTARADSLLSFVTGTLPNLNRPWYYQGQIKLAQGDTVFFKTAMNRSMLLDGRDYLPPLALAKYHEKYGEVYDAIYYYRLALRNYQNIDSPHYKKTAKYYQSQTLLNDVVPSQLLKYTKPHLDVQGICKCLVLLYKKKEKEEMAQYFKDYLAGKYTLNQILKLSSNGI